jgi:anti-sigma factor (TIGR02949 family)
MNCQEALSLLYDIIDKEASEIDEQAVREHIENCRDCRGIYEVEAKVNDFLQARLDRSVPGDRLELLRGRIVKELDSIDSGGASACNHSSAAKKKSPTQ